MTATRQAERLKRFRDRRDEFMRTHESSPLTDTQKESFVPLDYYDENPDLRFELVPDMEIDHTPVELGTTSGTTVEYIPHSQIAFEVDGSPVVLTVFREPGRGRLLIPFKDATSGASTYGAGRTVDPQERPDGKLVVDFNYAYGPYCQYNDNWTCTLPPFSNWLQVPIRAGEKKYPNKETEFPDD
ncbi:MAG: DUF1684 domain-containing protein [Thermomicrobiales bacterium]